MTYYVSQQTTDRRKNSLDTLEEGMLVELILIHRIHRIFPWPILFSTVTGNLYLVGIGIDDTEKMLHTYLIYSYSSEQPINVLYK